MRSRHLLGKPLAVAFLVSTIAAASTSSTFSDQLGAELASAILSGNMAHNGIDLSATTLSTIGATASTGSDAPSPETQTSTTDTDGTIDPTTTSASTAKTTTGEAITAGANSSKGTTEIAGLLTVDTLGTTVGSAASATGSPAITPPPVGSSGSLPTTIPPLESRKPDVAVVINDETYVLPQDGDLELPQSDGSIITLLPNSVVSGPNTISVPEAAGAAATILAAGVLSIKAGPAVGGPSSGESGGSAGGSGGGSGGLTDVLDGLSGTANSISNAFDQISEQGVSFAANGMDFKTFSTSIGPSLDSAISDLTSFVSRLTSTINANGQEVYEMTEDGLRRITEAQNGAVKQLDLLKSIKNLTKDFSKIKEQAEELAKQYWDKKSTKALTLAASAEAVRRFGSYTGAWGKAAQSSTVTTTTTMSNSTETAEATMSKSSSTKTDGPTATPRPFVIVSKPGTDPAMFKDFVKTLPDEGSGDLWTANSILVQTYQTNLTWDQAFEVEKESFIDYAVAVTAVKPETNDLQGAIPMRRTRKRADAEMNLQEMENSPSQLKLISAPKDNPAGQRMPNYRFDSTLGKGQTIYIVDTGFNPDHIDFATNNDRAIDTFVVPNSLTLPGLDSSLWPPEDIRSWDGHGTKVASAAGGVFHGSAPRADLVIVKVKQSAENPNNRERTPFYIPYGMSEPALTRMATFILDDVNAKRANGYKGGFVVNLSWGLEISRPADAPPSVGVTNKETILEGFRTRCELNDIGLHYTFEDHSPTDMMQYVIPLLIYSPELYCTYATIGLANLLKSRVLVIAAGNDGSNGVSLDERTPSNLGSDTNEVITVGGVDLNGVLAPRTTFKQGTKGSLTTYALSERVLLADGEPRINRDEDGGRIQTYSNVDEKLDDGTSFAAPVVAGMCAYFFSLPSLAEEWKPLEVGKRMKTYLTKHHYQRATNPIPPNLPPKYSIVPAADSIKVAWNRAPEGLCAGQAPPKRAAGSKRARAASESAKPSYLDLIVSGTTVEPSFCNAESPSSATTATATSSDPTTESSYPTSTGTSSTGTTSTSLSDTLPAPTQRIESGILTCGTRTDQGNSAYFFSRDDMTDARDDFCSDLTGETSEANFEPGKQTFRANAFSQDGMSTSITVSVTYDEAEDPACPAADFTSHKKKMRKLCEDRLNVIIDTCDTAQNGEDLWKQGGKFYRECITWHMTAGDAVEEKAADKTDTGFADCGKECLS